MDVHTENLSPNQDQDNLSCQSEVPVTGQSVVKSENVTEEEKYRPPEEEIPAEPGAEIAYCTCDDTEEESAESESPKEFANMEETKSEPQLTENVDPQSVLRKQLCDPNLQTGTSDMEKTMVAIELEKNIDTNTSADMETVEAKGEEKTSADVLDGENTTPGSIELKGDIDQCMETETPALGQAAVLNESVSIDDKITKQGDAKIGLETSVTGGENPPLLGSALISGKENVSASCIQMQDAAELNVPLSCEQNISPVSSEQVQDTAEFSSSLSCNQNIPSEVVNSVPSVQMQNAVELNSSLSSEQNIPSEGGSEKTMIHDSPDIDPASSEKVQEATESKAPLPCEQTIPSEVVSEKIPTHNTASEQLHDASEIKAPLHCEQNIPSELVSEKVLTQDTASAQVHDASEIKAPLHCEQNISSEVVSAKMPISLEKGSAPVVQEEGGTEASMPISSTQNIQTEVISEKTLTNDSPNKDSPLSEVVQVTTGSSVSFSAEPNIPSGVEAEKTMTQDLPKVVEEHAPSSTNACKTSDEKEKGPVISDFLKCKVCNEVYSDPVILPCSHILCRWRCASKLFQENIVTCALCPVRSVVEGGVVNLPVAQTFSQMVKSLGQEVRCMPEEKKADEQKKTESIDGKVQDQLAKTASNFAIYSASTAIGVVDKAKATHETGQSKDDINAPKKDSGHLSIKTAENLTDSLDGEQQRNEDTKNNPPGSVAEANEAKQGSLNEGPKAHGLIKMNLSKESLARVEHTIEENRRASQAEEVDDEAPPGTEGDVILKSEKVAPPGTVDSEPDSALKKEVATTKSADSSSTNAQPITLVNRGRMEPYNNVSQETSYTAPNAQAQYGGTYNNQTWPNWNWQQSVRPPAWGSSTQAGWTGYGTPQGYWPGQTGFNTQAPTLPSLKQQAQQYAQQYNQWQQNFNPNINRATTPYGQYQYGQGYQQNYYNQGYNQQGNWYGAWPMMQQQNYQYNAQSYQAGTQQAYQGTTPSFLDSGTKTVSNASASSQNKNVINVPLSATSEKSIEDIPLPPPTPVEPPVEHRSSYMSHSEIAPPPLPKSPPPPEPVEERPPEPVAIPVDLTKEEIAAQLLKRARKKTTPDPFEEGIGAKRFKPDIEGGGVLLSEEGAPQRHICIGNLPDGTKAATLRDLLADYGRVVMCKVAAGKGKNAGIFAFVTIETPTDAHALVSTLNGWDFNGSKLKVKKLKTPPGGKSA